MMALSLESIKNLAQNMNFVSFDILHVEQYAVKSHWFRHEQGLDLYYFQKDDGRLVKLHIAFFGQVIEWNPLDGTRTGMMVEEEMGSEVVETVHFDARANRESLAQCLMIIENASCLENDLRFELLSLLQLPQEATNGELKKRDSFLGNIKQKIQSFFRAA